MKRPFSIKVVIVLADGGVEQHVIMCDHKGVGRVIREATEASLKTSMILAFRDGARFYPKLEIISEEEIRFSSR